MSKVLVTLTPQSMKMLPRAKKKTPMGYRAPSMTLPSLKKMLDSEVDPTFKIESTFGETFKSVERGDVRSLRQLSNLGITEVHVIKPGGDDDWAMLHLNGAKVRVGGVS